MDKKQVLIIIDSLGAGGAEKSLVSLLSLMDFTKVDVDLLMFARGGINEQFVPVQVNILPVVGSEKCGIFRKISNFINRLRFSASIRLKKVRDFNDSAVRYWNCMVKHYPAQRKKYDTVISYAHRVPAFYALSKVDATQKIAWVNVTMKPEVETLRINRPVYALFDKVVCVSAQSFKAFVNCFPEFEDKTTIIYDIINPDFIRHLSEKTCKIKREKGITNLLTVARLNFNSKGYDIALEACRILRDRGVRFRWYAVGNGDKEEEIRNIIAEKGMQDVFILCGIDPNPYPYYRQADIYVQTSRYEGFGLSIAEARLLDVPVVSTPYDSVGIQLENEVNSLISTFDPESVASAIQRLIEDRSLYDQIRSNLAKEKKGNTEEYTKIENLLGI